MAIRTPLKAIRAKCIDCTNGQNVEIRECPIVNCPLWEYRMGHRPKKSVEGDFSEDDSEDEEISRKIFQIDECPRSTIVESKKGDDMSDSRLDIERDKYLEWKDQQKEAMRSACENCDSHKTLGCLYYDPEEETFDYEECFRDSGGWE